MSTDWLAIREALVDIEESLKALKDNGGKNKQDEKYYRYIIEISLENISRELGEEK